MLINKDIVNNIAVSLGFDLVGFSKIKPLTNEVKYLNNWLKNGYNGGMKYLENNIDKRENPKLLIEDAKSVISLGLNYYSGEKFTNEKSTYKISRYAWGKDYHFVMWDKLKVLIEKIKEVYPHFNSIYYVDTGPVMDKVWAVSSGLGWMGKNTNVINKNIGSWFFIGNIFCNVEFEEYSTVSSDFCGTCKKCIEACPTEALLGNYQINASKCISYLNIENKNEIPIEFSGKFDNWLLGCDICQEVCPWNKKKSVTSKEINFIEGTSVQFKYDELINLTNFEFKQKFKDSPILRPKLKGIKRNLNFLKNDNNGNQIDKNESNNN